MGDCVCGFSARRCVSFFSLYVYTFACLSDGESCLVIREVAELEFFFFFPLSEHFGVGQKAALISGKCSCCLCSEGERERKGGRIWRGVTLVLFHRSNQWIV